MQPKARRRSLCTAAGSAASTTTVSATHTQKYVVADCDQWQVEPSGYVFTCDDGGAGLEGLHWATAATPSSR